MTAAARLSFLNPRLMRAVRAGGPSRASAGLARHRGTFARRRGKAIEPSQLHGTKQKEIDPLPNIIEVAAPSIVALDQSSAQQLIQSSDPGSIVNDANANANANASANDSDEPKPRETPEKPSSPPEEEQTPGLERARLAREEAKQSGPLEAVLHMQSPENMTQPGPTLTPRPYVHHFDTYSLVKQLQDGGYTLEQATMAMKAIRAALAQNLQVAQSTLVSKSDVENETYLFKAACSELATEIKNNRRLEEEQLRQQRTHLQHEVDILNQSLNQELLTLNDHVRGMFNDRKMAVREEQKAAESAVQQINYKISIMLSSDAKSDIEEVRWILIRRSVLGILFMAVLTLGTLRYATYVSHERQKEADQKRKEEEQIRRDGGKKDHSADADAAAILAAN